MCYTILKYLRSDFSLTYPVEQQQKPDGLFGSHSASCPLTKFPGPHLKSSLHLFSTWIELMVVVVVVVVVVKLVVVVVVEAVVVCSSISAKSEHPSYASAMTIPMAVGSYLTMSLSAM